jgi:DUF1365 family protein
LQECSTAVASSPFWSINKPNLAWFRRKDHFGDPSIALDQTVRLLVSEKTGIKLGGPVRMLSHFRYFGHCFNPATFYFCFDKSGQEVDAIVIEVHNTPWGEQHCYVLPADRASGKRAWHYNSFDKTFHVSPFMSMDMQYDWRIRTPGSVLNIHMNSFKKGEKFFDATLALQRKEISGALLNRLLFTYPPMTMKVICMIYWQALRLLIKRIPVYDHPKQQGGSPGNG